MEEGETRSFSAAEQLELLGGRRRGGAGHGRRDAISARRASPARRGPRTFTLDRRPGAPARRRREPNGAGRGGRRRHRAAARADREHERAVDRGAARRDRGRRAVPSGRRRQPRPHRRRCSTWRRREPTSCSSPVGSGRPRTTSPATRSRASWACRSSATRRSNAGCASGSRGSPSGSMPANNLRQADVPRGARTIENDRGSAPGLVADLPGGARVYAMPGVPGEMQAMMRPPSCRSWRERIGVAVVRSRTLRCVGIGESRVAEILADLFAASANPSLAYLASAGEVKVRLTAKADSVERRRGDDRAARDRGARAVSATSSSRSTTRRSSRRCRGCCSHRDVGSRARSRSPAAAWPRA